ALMAPAAEQKSLQLRIDLDPRLPCWLMGDSLRLRQVILNLLGNAVKFTERGSVTVTARPRECREGGRVLVLEVADSGIGITAEAQAALFERFVQADGATARRYGGAGLGLAISRELAGLMGGDLVLSSQLGLGTTVTLTLLLDQVDPPARSLPAAAPAGAAAGPAPAHILLVEDVPLNRELAVAILTGAGHRVDVAGNGQEAVEAARSRRYDLVLMDVQMPVMDGLAATRAIRRDEESRGHSAVPILALTAGVFPAQIEACRDAGMNGHLAKP
ncbi:hypothetical protein N826_15515, partial [Skermanella aerolata KACC 11604]